MLPQLSKPGATAAPPGLSSAFEPRTGSNGALSVGDGAGQEGLNSFAFLLRAGTALPPQPGPLAAAQDTAAAGEELPVPPDLAIARLVALAGQLAAEPPAAGETAPAEAEAAAAPNVLPLAPPMARPAAEAGEEAGEVVEEEMTGEEPAERQAAAEAEAESEGENEAASGSPLKDGIPAAAADLPQPDTQGTPEEGDRPLSSSDSQGGSDPDSAGEGTRQHAQTVAEAVASGAEHAEAPQEDTAEALRSAGAPAREEPAAQARPEAAGDVDRSEQAASGATAKGAEAKGAEATGAEATAAEGRRSEPSEKPARGAASPAGGSEPASARPGGEARPESAGAGKAMADARGGDPGRSGSTSAPANAPTAPPSPEASAGLATARAAAFLEALGNGRGRSASGTPGGAESLGSLTAGGEAAAARGLAPAQAGTSDIRPAAPGLLADQVVVHIRSGAAAGLQRMTLQLNPAEMGRLDIRLEFTSDGTLRALISAERPEAMDVLQRDSRGLERMLADAGIKTDSQSLSFDLREQSQQRERMDQQARGEQTGDQRDRNAKEDSGNPTHQPPPASYRGLINLSV